MLGRAGGSADGRPARAEEQLATAAIGRALGCHREGARRVGRGGKRANAAFRRDYRRLARRRRLEPPSLEWPRAETFCRAVRADGRPLVLATLHLGNYLSGLLALAEHLRFLQRIVVIRRSRAHPLEGPALRHFARRGLELEVARTRERPARAALRALRSGGHVLLLYDVPPTFDIGRWAAVPFLGLPAAFPTGPAELTRAGDALLWPFAFLPAAAGRASGRGALRLVDGPPIGADEAADVPRTTARLARLAEAWITAAPTRWLLWPHLPAFWATAAAARTTPQAPATPAAGAPA